MGRSNPSSETKFSGANGDRDNTSRIGNLFRSIYVCVCVVVVVVFTLKAVPVSTQYFLTSVLVQLTRTPSVVTG